MATDLFKNTHRSEMPLTSDYVFRTAFGRDRDDSRAALMEILNIILDRKDDPIQSIEIKNPIDTAILPKCQTENKPSWISVQKPAAVIF